MNSVYMLRETKIRKRILKLLSQHSEGLTVTDVTKHSSINYMTVSKYLAILKAEGKVKFRPVGMAKLFKIKRRR